MTKAELTAENRPAWLPSGVNVGQTHPDWITHKDQGGVEVLVILLGIVSVEFGGFLAIDGEEVGAGVVGFQWLEELLEGRTEAYRRSDIWWRVRLSSRLTTWDRVELESVPFPWTSFDLLRMMDGLRHPWRV